MSISFSGLASGLDTSSWVEALVSVKQQKVTSLQTDLQKTQNQKSTLNSTRSTFSSLRSAIEKLTDMKFGGTFDLFGKNTATSSDESVFSATATSGAIRQNYNISVQQLATATKATSIASASTVADDDTKLANLGITEGKFSVFVDGYKTAINIGKEDTVATLKSQLDAAGITANIDEDGVLHLTAKNEGTVINVGATTDSSNLVSLIGLNKNPDGSYSSTNSLFKATTASKLTSADAGFKTQITEGTFTIGNAEFTINANTTLSGLISQINNTEEAQANAYWDDTTGKLTITSTKEGASYINIEAGTSNFTEVMGFTTGAQMITDTQELGKNALFTVNGTSMVSTSNTVSSDISRIEGVTLTLNGVSEDNEESVLKVSQDTTDLVDAVRNFVDSYNETISKIDEVTAKGADLERESSLTSFKNTIRNYANSRNTIANSQYSLLSQLGISTAKAEGGNLSTDTNALEFDEDVLLQALEEDPSSVAVLLAGENGILQKMENAVETTLKANSGFFDIKQSTYDSDIRKAETKIKSQQEKVSTYKAQLEKKFQAMEAMIAQMQQNYSNFLTS